MSDIALNLIVLRCSNLEQAAEFYARLGLSLTRHRHGRGEEHLAAEIGGVVFELYPSKAKATSTREVRIGFRVPAIDSVLAAFHDIPGTVIVPPKNSPWGRRAVIMDRDGHHIELIEESRSPP